MNRHARRGEAKRAGVDWRDRRQEEILARARAETEAAAAARKRLAEWAARPGRSQAEVDKLNGGAR